ncbi:putative uncharacterized protein [Rhodococcus sp. AW25M09]|uniref:DUF6885 family protein n=1 Tax=Rhodococcus sp. AW25M09 TaxID=1268303 RepID=UPI0002ACDCA3|nr:hypothetical protein [Rhodococcus sp. AW25M09]CCQ17297.1 putative uncharacterized protein [Rhodococcus sp. AW25M09]
MLKRFAGVTAILSALDHALPQPDRLCGPFSASVALTAVLDDDIPDVTAVAVASGSTIWPVAAEWARPPGSPLITDGWDCLPRAASIESAGTTAAGLSTGIETATEHRVAVVPIMRPGVAELSLLLARLGDARFRFGLIANVHTAGLTDFDWNVGHFVTVWGADTAEDMVAIADTYRELGHSAMPPGCRTVPTDAFASAMSERGLLLIVDVDDQRAAESLVRSLELHNELWSV